jgi:hypothetical protein
MPMKSLMDPSLDMERARRDPLYRRRVRLTRYTTLTVLYLLPLLAFVAIDHQGSWGQDVTVQVISITFGFTIALQPWCTMGRTFVIYPPALTAVIFGAMALARHSAMMAPGAGPDMLTEYFFPELMMIAPIGMVACGTVAGCATAWVRSDDYLFELMERDDRTRSATAS